MFYDFHLSFKTKRHEIRSKKKTRKKKKNLCKRNMRLVKDLNYDLTIQEERVIRLFFLLLLFNYLLFIIKGIVKGKTKVHRDSLRLTKQHKNKFA